MLGVETIDHIEIFPLFTICVILGVGAHYALGWMRKGPLSFFWKVATKSPPKEEYEVWGSDHNTPKAICYLRGTILLVNVTRSPVFSFAQVPGVGGHFNPAPRLRNWLGCC